CAVAAADKSSIAAATPDLTDLFPRPLTPARILTPAAASSSVLAPHVLLPSATVMFPEKKQILVVDDEVNLRRVLSAQLARDGYEVHVAEDGEAALAFL